MEENLMNFSRRKTRRKLTSCKVCLAPAIYYYVGAIVCPSCKVFFKRNSQNKTKIFKCHFDGNCEVDIRTRHVCAHCRLKKCYQVGMKAELLRGPLVKSNKIEKNFNVQIFPLNLLRNDTSNLTDHQWRILSNLVNCYDENLTLNVAKNFLIEQNKIPSKFRFKIGPVNQFLQSIVSGVQIFFEKNGDFLGLNRHDQSMVLGKSLKQLAGLVACFILRKSNLYENEIFYRTIETIYGETTIRYGADASLLFESDFVFVKLFFSVMIFSSLDSTFFLEKNFDQLDNIFVVQRLQDFYVEIAWKYLLYRHDLQYAVRAFSNLIRCVFIDIRSLVEAAKAAEFHSLMNSVVKQTEEVLCIQE